ncbi:hypothetical protein Tco_0715137 [Tanacetum coccineum]
MTELLNESIYTESTTITVTPLLETIQETQEDRVGNVSESPPATPPTKTKKKRAKTLLHNTIENKNDWKKLYDMMFESGSSISHQAHRELYDVIGKSIRVEKLEARYGKAPFSKKKRSHDDQDPPENREGEKNKRRCKDTCESSSKKGKAQDGSPHYERVEDV